MEDRGLRFKVMARGRGMLPLPAGESQGKMKTMEKAFSPRHVLGIGPKISTNGNFRRWDWYRPGG